MTLTIYSNNDTVQNALSAPEDYTFFKIKPYLSHPNLRSNLHGAIVPRQEHQHSHLHVGLGRNQIKQGKQPPNKPQEHGAASRNAGSKPLQFRAAFSEA